MLCPAIVLALLCHATLGMIGACGANLPPVANFTYWPQQPTVEDVVTFLDRSSDPDGSIASWLWFFGDGSSSAAQNPQHRFASKGRYLINLIVCDNEGATDTAIGFIDVGNLPPRADFSFSPSRPTIRDEVVFNDTSIDPDGPVVSWLWLFGDGSSSNLKDPTHRYERKGRYLVVLNVSDEEGMFGVVQKFVEIVNLPPEANFSFSPEKVRRVDEVLFIDLSHDPDGLITSWLWDFGDNSTSTIQNPTHRYAALGRYRVNMTILDDEGMARWVTKTLVVVNALPEANFTFSPSVAGIGEAVAFVDHSRDPDGTIESWLWSFGDGTDSTSPAPRHIYDSRGLYRVTLAVTDNDGGQSNLTGYVRVIGRPPEADFSFSPASITTKDLVSFMDTSRDADSPISAWLWDFGDGSKSGLKNTKHTYQIPGTYYVNLTVWDDDGLPSSIVKALTVRKGSNVPAWLVALPVGLAMIVLFFLAWSGRGKRSDQDVIPGRLPQGRPPRRAGPPISRRPGER